MINNLINVKNCDNETKAEIITQNKIEFIPKVSVVIPVYNVELYLRQCLDSVINQTLKDIEIICIDDASTDNSLKILKEYATKDSRIKIFHNQQNFGAPGKVKNLGISLAKGEYIGFVDADDYVDADYFKTLYFAAIKNNADLALALNIIKFTTDEQIKYTYFCKNTDVLNSIKDRIPLIKKSGTNCLKLFRKDFLSINKLSCWPEYCIAEDNYLSILAMLFANKIAIGKGIAYHYRKGIASITSGKRTNKDFNIFNVYKAIDTKIEQILLNEINKSKMRDAVKERKIFDFICFKNDVNPQFLNAYKDALMANYPELYFSIFRKNDIIVSLTSYPARINTVHLTIKSILEQSLKADKVILWLAPEQFPNKEKDLPKQLLDLCDKGLTIDWYHDIKSYKKLIPTLKKYPEAIIVTADDDLIFDPDWLKLLYASYINAPENIHCHRITRLFIGGTKLKVLHRKLYLNDDERYRKELCAPSAFNKLNGGAGTLYPPHCFSDDVLDEKTFMSIAPTSDDIWFWLLALLVNRRVMVVSDNRYELHYVPASQANALCKINDVNNFQIFYHHLNAIIRKFPTLNDIFKNEDSANRQLIKMILQNENLYRKDIEDWYKRVMKKPLNLDNPKTFNEKIQWLKLYDSTPIKTRLADKYLVRDWVKEKIGEEYLIELLGVYDRFEDIDFDKLPDRFVIKCNHGSGYNIIVKDKSKLDLSEVKTKLDKWMAEDYAFRVGYELHYSNIERKIIIEKFMEDFVEDLYDYRFFCCSGKVEQIWLDVFSGTPQHKRKIYDRNWKELNFTVKWPRLETEIEKPENLSKMISLAESLSQGFALVRVDFYNVNSKIYFGEMTFTSMSGTGVFSSKKADLALARKIKLPEMAYDINTEEYYKLPKLSWFDKLKRRRQTRKQKEKLIHNAYKKLCQALRTGKTEIINKSTDYTTLIVKSKKANVLAIENGSHYQLENKQLQETIKLKVNGKCPTSLKFSSANGYPLVYKSIKINKKEILGKPIQLSADCSFDYDFIAKPDKKNKIEVQKQYYPFKKHDLKIMADNLELNKLNQKQLKKVIRRTLKTINGGFWSKLFSVRYKDNKKIVRILGLKFKFKL